MGRDRASLPCPGSSLVADCDEESGRLEASTGSVTISPDLIQAFSTQLPPEEQEIGEEPMKPDRTG